MENPSRPVVNGLLDVASSTIAQGLRRVMVLRPAWGPSIPREERESVFEPLVQLGDGIMDKPAGTGLGLSLCRQILDAVGGRIWCEESELGGAQISVLVPVAAAVAAETDTRRLVEEGAVS